MYGDERRTEIRRYDNDELYARLHALERKDTRGIFEPVESTLIWRKVGRRQHVLHFQDTQLDLWGVDGVHPPKDGASRSICPRRPFAAILPLPIGFLILQQRFLLA